MADPRVEPASPGRAEDRPAISFAILGLCLLAVLTILFAESFERGKVLFSNDRTLGLISSEADQLPGIFLGYWADLNWVGYAMPSAAPDINYAVNSILTPVQFLKFFPPFSLFFLGLSAGLCFRQLGFGPLVCVLGGLAAALNSNVFSNVCWGQTSRALCLGTSFLAAAALHTRPVKWGWLSPLVAGLAVGMGVMDGLDVGALFSLCIAAYVLFHSWTGEGSLRRRLAVGAGKVAIIAVFAALTAAHGLSTMIQTQVQGVSGMEQDEESRERRWVQATVWSLPKIETLRVIIPGLFGYRMDSEGRNYWGAVGQVPEVKTSRSSGAGEYAGVLVVLIALWGAAQALRGNSGGYGLRERRWIGFWCGVALITVLLAWGRHAPFYQFVYALPYFSTIRNPIKFMHVFHFALLILFGYGLHHLVRHHLGAAAGKTASIGGQLKLWWAERSFGKGWTVGCLIVAGVSAAIWVMMMASHEKWAAHIQELGFPASLAGEIARSSIGEVGWFVVWLFLGSVAMALVFSGALAGGRVKWAGIILGLLLVLDLGGANLPWIIYQNHIRKYATNPVLDVLREAPYEARVTLLPLSPGAFPPPMNGQLATLQDLYNSEWKQHLFQYYNIQSLDVIQEPRVTVENEAYRDALSGTSQGDAFRLMLRKWELTNTRLVFGLGGDVVNALNEQLDPVHRRFRVHTAFDPALKEGVTQAESYEDLTAIPNPNGTCALIEFTGALPRAGLYADWRVEPDDDVVLRTLADPGFDPARTVLLSDAPPAGAAAPDSDAGASAGTVTYESYAPKHLMLEAEVELPAVLLLNDKYHPDWKVTVNGKPADLLRANFLMRGVYLEPGRHTIEFRYDPPHFTLYISLMAIVAGLAFCGVLVAKSGRRGAVQSRNDTRRAA